MLIGRQFEPGDDDLIFHYCGPEAFMGLTKFRRLWFSDVFSMNDAMELRWGYSIFEAAAGELHQEIPKEFFDKIDSIIASAGMHVLPLICCFSMDGDVLSQWRAYAQDGRGFAVGFSAKELANMPVRSLKILYNRAEQIAEMKTVLRAIYDVEKSEGFTYGSDFGEVCQSLAIDLCAFKNPGFREEQEVRLAHVINFHHDGKGMSLKSAGGTAWGQEFEGEAVSFRMRDEITVPYVALDFSNSGAVNPIKRVMLGPKNRNSPSNIHVYLETLGLKGVEIGRSEASYV